jgi:hypothetical protein
MLQELSQLMHANGCENFQVLDPHGDQLIVRVASQVADALDEASDHVCFLDGKLADLRAIDGWFGTPGHTPHDLQEETLGTHPVELCQLGESFEGDASLRPLVTGYSGWSESTI